jgi:hypothetical protein
MKEHERTHLETKLKELRGTLTSLADGAGFEQFIRTIHKPGFTTVAEAALLLGIAEAMNEHSKIALQLKQVLISGAEKVELNPQPLPP